MEKDNQYSETQQLLLGLEVAYPQFSIISKIRFSCESLKFHTSDSRRIFNDLFNTIKIIGNYEITPFLEVLINSKCPKETLLTILKIQEGIHKNDSFSALRLCLKNFNTVKDLDELNPIIIKYLESDKIIGSELKAIYLEVEFLEKIKKILDFLNKIYSEPLLIYLKDFYKHYVLESSTQKLWFFLYKCTDLYVINRIKRLKQIELAPRLGESFSKGQIKSKIWAIEEIKKLEFSNRKNILILCSWYGLLSRLLFDFLSEDTYINTVDMDPSTFVASTTLNYPEVETGYFVAYEKNILDIEYDNYILQNSEKVDLIINTSCEHLNDFLRWYDRIDNGELLLLQSNNFFSCEEHVNCVSSIDEFKKQAPMAQIIYEGSLALEEYTRFMLIGYK